MKVNENAIVRFKNDLFVLFNFQTNFMIHDEFWWRQTKKAAGLRQISWNFSLLAIFLRQFYWPFWAHSTAISWMDLLLSNNFMCHLNSCEYSISNSTMNLWIKIQMYFLNCKRKNAFFWIFSKIPIEHSMFMNIYLINK